MEAKRSLDGRSLQVLMDAAARYADLVEATRSPTAPEPGKDHIVLSGNVKEIRSSILNAKYILEHVKFYVEQESPATDQEEPVVEGYKGRLHPKDITWTSKD